MEKREPATKRGAHLRTRLVYIMAMMSFFFIYKVLDPLGLESATKQTSAGLFNALTAPFYGADNANTHRHVAVVEVNDASLERFGTAFPLSYTRHIAILNQILDAHPAAVFVDFRMMREQPGETLDSFAPLLARAHSMNVPLLFARGEAGDKQPSLPPILKPDQVYSNGLESTGSYPLVEEKDEATETSKAVNPAWSLYETLCRNAWTARCGDIQAENFDRPMVIRWGLAPDPAQSLVSNQGDYWQSNCAIWREGPCTRLTAASRLALAYLFLHSRGSEKQFAFYPLVIGAEQLGHSSRNTLPGSPALAALLTDRAVFYGSDIRDQHDDSVVPLLGRVPGVVTHAMAFDNLVTYGARYFHEPPELAQIGWLRLDKAELLEALIWLMCSIALIMRPKSKPLGKYTGDDVACTTRQHRKHQARSSIRRRTLACMLGAFLIVAVPTCETIPQSCCSTMRSSGCSSHSFSSVHGPCPRFAQRARKRKKMVNAASFLSSAF